MATRSLIRNNRGLDKNALLALRRAPPPSMNSARTSVHAIHPNVARLYAEMASVPPSSTRRNVSKNKPVSMTLFYPNVPTTPGPGSLAYKLKMEDPRPVSSWESSIRMRKTRKARKTRRSL